MCMWGGMNAWKGLKVLLYIIVYVPCQVHFVRAFGTERDCLSFRKLKIQTALVDAACYQGAKHVLLLLVSKVHDGFLARFGRRVDSSHGDAELVLDGSAVFLYNNKKQ